MKAAWIAGVALVVLGIISLAYQEITYKTQKPVLDVGPVHATKTENRTVPLSPVLGGIAMVGGIVLMVVGARES